MAPSLTFYENNSYLEPAGVFCAQCQNEINFTDEVFLLRVVQPFIIDGMLRHFDVLNEQGDYKYEPAFFEFECWEEEQENLENMQEDVPPLEDVTGIINCDVCQSSILQGEIAGLLNFGEIRWSERSPNNRNTATFVPMGDGKHVCVVCLCHLDANRDTPIWQDSVEPVPGIEVCIDGVFERCWRYGGCTCPMKACPK